MAGLYYEKGKRLVERGTGSSISLGKESLERAISMYERDGYEDSDKLCGSYLILADAEMDGVEKNGGIWKRRKVVLWICQRKASGRWETGSIGRWELPGFVNGIMKRLLSILTQC